MAETFTDEDEIGYSRVIWRCPKCGSDALEVVIETWAELIQSTEESGEIVFETDLDGAREHDHEWTGDSVMRCRNWDCGFVGIAAQFDTEALDSQEPLRVKTSINLPREFKNEVLAKLDERGAQMSGVVEEMLKEWLTRRTT
jgi:hypothetical protein